MNSQRVIEAAVRAAQDFLWQNAPPMHSVADDVTVARLHDLVRSPAIQAALLQSSDAFLTFVLRASSLWFRISRRTTARSSAGSGTCSTSRT
jgi:hypothetical protein